MQEDAQDAPTDDLEGFFWRQVVAHSPLTRVPGTPYDDAWRAINQLLIHGSIASRQRNVFLRNDGRGGFDEMAGAIGLDLDQDGRSFALLDIDRDGDQDLVVMAARQAPQLRVFRNDFATPSAALAVRLVGGTSNRDAIGARVIVEADRMRRTRIVQAGSGFLSQHAKELLIGLGASQGAVKVTVEWPSGGTQVVTDVAVNTRLRIVEAGEVTKEALAAKSAATAAAPVSPSGTPARDTWLDEPLPAPEFSLPDVSEQTRSLAALKGRPAVVLLFAPDVTPAREALQTLERGARSLTQAGVGSIAIAIDGTRRRRLAVRRRRRNPVVAATADVGVSYAILNRHVFMNRQHLRLPTCLLLDASGNIVKVYRDRVDVAQIVKDASAIDVSAAERLSRAIPFSGTSMPACRDATICRTAGSCSIRGWSRRRSSRSNAPRRRTRARARSIAWARCSRGAARRRGRDRHSSARWSCSRISRRPTTISARCSERKGTSKAPSAGSVAALASTPETRTR